MIFAYTPEKGCSERTAHGEEPLAGYKQDTLSDGQTPETGKYLQWKGEHNQRECRNRVHDVEGLERLPGGL